MIMIVLEVLKAKNAKEMGKNCSEHPVSRRETSDVGQSRLCAVRVHALPLRTNTSASVGGQV